MVILTKKDSVVFFTISMDEEGVIQKITFRHVKKEGSEVEMLTALGYVGMGELAAIAEPREIDLRDISDVQDATDDSMRIIFGEKPGWVESTFDSSYQNITRYDAESYYSLLIQVLVIALGHTEDVTQKTLINRIVANIKFYQQDKTQCDFLIPPEAVEAAAAAEAAKAAAAEEAAKAAEAAEAVDTADTGESSE